MRLTNLCLVGAAVLVLFRLERALAQLPSVSHVLLTSVVGLAIAAAVYYAANWLKPPILDLFLFKGSPLFTKRRVKRISRDLTDFRSYLIRLGFEVPERRLPIGVGSHAMALGGDTQVGVGAYTIYLNVDQIDDKMEATKSFVEFVIARILSPPRTVTLPIDYTQFRTAEFVARNVIADDLASYFNWSYWGRPNNLTAPKAWRGAFWKMREKFGAKFTDALLTYMVKSFAESPAPAQFSNRLIEETSFGLPNELVDNVVYCHLEQAEKVVDNHDAKLPTMQSILRDFGLSIPE